MMVPGAKQIFDEALEAAAFPVHADIAEQKLQMASGLLHYAYICLDINSVEYTQLQQRIQMVRENRAAKTMRQSRVDARV